MNHPTPVDEHTLRLYQAVIMQSIIHVRSPRWVRLLRFAA